jgi:transposase-like protein
MSEEKLKNREFSAEFKARVVLELIRGDVSVSEASRRYDIKDTTLWRWKKEFIERSASVFGGNTPSSEQERRISELEQLFKEQSLELAILKKAQKLLLKKSGGPS